MMRSITLAEAWAMYHGLVGQVFAREHVCELVLIVAVSACVMGLRRCFGVPDMRG